MGLGPCGVQSLDPLAILVGLGLPVVPSCAFPWSKQSNVVT